MKENEGEMLASVPGKYLRWLAEFGKWQVKAAAQNILANNGDGEVCSSPLEIHDVVGIWEDWDRDFTRAQTSDVVFPKMSL
jgi:hypothetical protein